MKEHKLISAITHIERTRCDPYIPKGTKPTELRTETYYNKDFNMVEYYYYLIRGSIFFNITEFVARCEFVFRTQLPYYKVLDPNYDFKVPGGFRSFVFHTLENKRKELGSNNAECISSLISKMVNSRCTLNGIINDIERCEKQLSIENISVEKEEKRRFREYYEFTTGEEYIKSRD